MLHHGPWIREPPLKVVKHFGQAPKETGVTICTILQIYEMSPNHVIYFQIFFNPLSFPPTFFSMLPSVHINLATLEPGNKDKSGKIYVGSLGKFMIAIQSILYPALSSMLGGGTTIYLMTGSP